MPHRRSRQAPITSIVGEDPGSKMAKAEKLGVKTITYADLLGLTGKRAKRAEEDDHEGGACRNSNKFMKAIVAGTSLLRSTLFKNWDEFIVETPYGKVSVSKASQYLFLQRHGKKAVPPHMINHRANIWALKSLDVEGVIAVNSVGSLKIDP